MTIGMLWSPFIQNLVRYESGNVAAEGGLALLGRCVQYDGHGLAIDVSSHFPDPLLELNVMVSLTSGSSRNVNSPEFFCSTGNCTWPPVATLGFCSRCVDITNRINLNCTGFNMSSVSSDFKSTSCSVTLTNSTAGLPFTGNTASFENIMHITQVGGSSGLRYHAVRLLPKPVFTGGYRPPLSKLDFAATECSLNPCVLSYLPSVRDGLYDETLLDTFLETPPENSTWLHHQLQPPWGPERGIDPAANLSFGLSETVIVDWFSQGYLTQDPITGFVQTADGHTGIEFCSTRRPPDGAGHCTPSNTVSNIFNANYTAETCGSVNMDVFSCTMDGIARALTKTMRNAGVLANGTGAGDVFLAAGTAETAVTFVRVRWFWIALPVAVWLLGFATWAAVAVQTGRLCLQTWRDDPLPLLYLYRAGGSQRDDDNSHVNGEDCGFDDKPLSSGKARDEFLEAHDYSSWAYNKVSEGVHVQLRRLLPISDNEGMTAGTMRLVQVAG